MEARYSLVSLFEQNKEELVKQLSGLDLLTETSKVQNIVSGYFKSIFDADGTFRQGLSKSEDYILNSALELLRAQEEMAKQMIVKKPQEKKKEDKLKLESVSDKAVCSSPSPLGLMAGTTIGGLVGTIGGTWWALGGAIAGTALVLYCAYYPPKFMKRKVKSLPKDTIPVKKEEPVKIIIDTEKFLDIVRHICENVDNLIETFRTQIERVVDKYERLEKPTLEKTYGSLLDSIQSVLGVAYSNTDNEKRLAKIDDRLEQLVDSLENYGLEVIKYAEDNSLWFECLTSTKVSEPVMICPAIVKNGEVIRKGKVFVKE